MNPESSKDGWTQFKTKIECYARRKTKIRKAFVIMALIFLIVGIVLAAFSIQESYTEENTLDQWDLNKEPSTLNPQDLGPSWTLEMPEGSFFELNVSASNTVRMRIGTPTYDEYVGEMVLMNPIFNQVGTRFTQKVAVGATDTYQVEIKNEGTTSVKISGNVFAKKIVTIYRPTVYPYSSLGILVVLGGLASLIYGILTKPKKRRSKKKARKTRST
jgi:hypothetical protein